MRHTAILLISIALFANEARGQQWTLDACVDAALHNNVELKNSRLESEMAAEDKAQAFTNYFPQLSATGAGFIGAKDLMRGEMEVPMMGAMPLSMVKKGVLATLTALQPLYTGGQVIVGNKLAALQQEVRALQLEMTAKDVQQNVATYFWRLVALRSNITTLDAVDSQLQEVYRQTEQYLQAGVINRNELLRVQLKREEISSERLRLQNGIELVRMMLAQLCGADMATFDIIPGEIHSPQAPETYFLPADQALINREEVELTERSQRASELQVKMQRGKLLPSVAIGASGVYYNMTEKNQGNLVGLATVSIPISEWWGGSHAIRKAQMAAQQSRNTLQDVRQKLQIDILSAWNNLREAYAQIQIAQRSTEQADENLRLSRNQYDAGTLSLTDLLDAVTLYTQSHSRLDTACADYQAEYLRKTR